MLSLDHNQTLPKRIHEKIYFPPFITFIIDDCYNGLNHSVQAEFKK